MLGSKSRYCPTCKELKSGRAYRGGDQCKDCRRNRDLAIPPGACVKCEKPFDPAEFYFHGSGSGWRKDCKSCIAKVQKAYNAGVAHQPARTCRNCGSTKAAPQFSGPDLCRRCVADGVDTAPRAPVGDEGMVVRKITPVRFSGMFRPDGLAAAVWCTHSVAMTDGQGRPWRGVVWREVSSDGS